MIDQLNYFQSAIATFIKQYLTTHHGFNARSFYGEAFSLSLLALSGILDDISRTILLTSYSNLDKNDSEFHWEFNNYALLQYKKITHDDSVERYLNPLFFKGTRVTNWILLRSNTRILAQVDSKLAISEAKKRIATYQLSSGLIMDDAGVKSFQYHCFSLAMIIELFEQTGDEFFLESFQKGVSFIRNFILSNGETLYVGRGQNQAFGYGALIYVLANAYHYFQDTTVLGDIKRVLRFVGQFQREDGSFPLVMNSVETGIPQEIDPQDVNFPGWYPYNNYFDYLSFMGFFIAKAHEIMKDLDVLNFEAKKQENYRDKNFIKVVKPAYEAVISKTGGYWSNDLPIPYIVRKGKNITPCYGGEQFQKSLYSMEGIPLPYFTSFNKSIRWRAISFLNNDTLWILSLFGIMKRHFVFADSFIEINTKVFSLFRFKHIYLFLDNDKKICAERERMRFCGYEYSASGKIRKYCSSDKYSNIRIEVSNGS